MIPHALKLDSIPEGYSLKVDAGSSLGNVERTPQGGIKVPANLTASGVFEYNYSGKVVREYRSPEEVAKLVAGGTLESAPVTDDHPYSDGGEVNTRNFSRLAKGHGTGIKQDGNRVTGTVFVQDATLIAKIDSRKATDVSLGLQSRDIHTPGVTPDGKPYDVLQTDLRANHIAIVPKARVTGSALKLDSTGLPAREETRKVETMLTIKIDGIDYPLGTEAEQKAALKAMERYQAKLDSQASEAKAKLDGLQAKVDAAESTNKELKGKLDAALDPKAMEAAIAAKVAIRETAIRILGKEEAAKLDSDSAMQLAVIGKVFPGMKLDGKSADYLAAAFETASLKSDASPETGNSQVLTLLNGAPVVKQDAAPVLSPFEKMIAENAKLGTSKLALSK